MFLSNERPSYAETAICKDLAALQLKRQLRDDWKILDVKLRSRLLFYGQWKVIKNYSIGA